MKHLGKRIISLALLGAMGASTLALGGCGNSSGATNADGEQTYALRLATLYPADHEMTIAVQAACDKIEEETGGNVKIQIYPSDQLGDYTSVYEEIMKGTIDLMVSGVLTTYDSNLEIMNIPYLASSYEEAKEYIVNPDSYFFQTVLEHQRNLNIETLGIYLAGAQGVGAAKVIDNLMDPNAAKPYLIRCPSTDGYLWTAEGFGFNSVTINYSELYSSLQTGVCDGWLGGGAYVNYLSFRDVLKYFGDARCSFESIICIMTKDLYDGMPAEYQTIISDTFAESTMSFADQMEGLDEQAMQDMEAMGIEIYRPTEEEYETMREHFRTNVWPKYENTLDTEIFNSLIANGLREAA